MSSDDRGDTEALVMCLAQALDLKALPRAGWQRVGIERPESVAAHSWGIAWLVLSLCPPEIDRGHALALATIHDLPEVIAGDITPHDGVSAKDKRTRESAALQQLLHGHPKATALAHLWNEYERAETPEARFVKACDKLDMALQATVYGRDEPATTVEFVRSALVKLASMEPDFMGHDGARLIGWLEQWLADSAGPPSTSR